MRYVPAAIGSNQTILRVWRAFKDPYFDKIGQRIDAALPWWKRQIVVQIGANDGEREDPISRLLRNRRRWRGLLVEPLPGDFKQLVKNYGSSRRFMFEQSAVGTANGRLAFYHLDERARNSSHWRNYFDRIGSLEKSDLIHNLGNCVEAMIPYIVVTEVNVLTMGALLKKWAIDRIDALIVDAEGFDWEIIRQTLELGIKPEVIVFEYTHLDGEEQAAALKALAEYSIEQIEERDYVCTRRTHWT